MSQRQVRGLQGERPVDRCDGRAAERGDSLHRALLTDIPPDDLVDLVDLDR
jgi:hypothetical protein